ncbi:MAG: aspartate-semialdehyde dehydrogenase [Cytophagales bacterium]|jgi:aspartate-semialdehyde dehydrogenase|nr:aspartate-semialdehyde dehydrogenase [Cytophagales bacterium]MCA6387503.1 aspartate-semialdehyde dehydrogenase [Cytophagales bacterium]MCA6390668.1 aspartate-semialdehyde dehydrogenase [Cytophagales bacterium]MCA6395944.1 aspartate-semialdehyde dehydrogenase [Cytophagales bacterium]MCA6399815.1 aspartate-semialdehyde dehydrogenase [Cytophagales bacterium]
MKIVVVGATGLVGQEILKVLEERNVEFDQLYLVASAKSVGQKIKFRGKEYAIIGMQEAIDLVADIAIFSAGGNTSLEWAPKFAEKGTIVIDNSSAWRMDPTKKLIVPEINGSELVAEDKIIANPNCSTIQMVVALAPLHAKYKIKRIVVSTYQSVTGTGKDAVQQMMEERQGIVGGMKVYPHKIDMNALPHIDSFLENGYTKEEMKMVNETRKILNDQTIGVTSTTVRIPTIGGHSEAVNVEFYSDFDLTEVRQLLEESAGVIVQDDVKNNVYPMPINSHGKDEVFVGRLRRDESQPNTLNMWIVSDNLRKGAATNAVQIAEFLKEKSLVSIAGRL